MQSVEEFKEQHFADLAPAKSRLLTTKDQVGNFITDNHQLDKMIDFYSHKITRLGDSNLRESKKIWIDGMIAVHCRYTPNDSHCGFVETILIKLLNCNRVWGTNADLSDEKVIPIYQALIDNKPLEYVLNKFSYRDLTIYGW